MGGYWGGLSAGEREMQKYHARNLLPSPSPSLLVGLLGWMKCWQYSG